MKFLRWLISRTVWWVAVWVIGTTIGLYTEVLITEVVLK